MIHAIEMVTPLTIRTTFLYIFDGLECVGLSLLMSPFLYFWKMLDSNPESCRSKQARYQPRHPLSLSPIRTLLYIVADYSVLYTHQHRLVHAVQCAHQHRLVGADCMLQENSRRYMTFAAQTIISCKIFLLALLAGKSIALHTRWQPIKMTKKHLASSPPLTSYG